MSISHVISYLQNHSQSVRIEYISELNNFIDTNNKIFSTGMFNLNEGEKILKQEKVKFIIVKTLVNEQAQLLELGHFISINFLNSHCEAVKTYPIKKDYYSNLLVVWECGF